MVWKSRVRVRRFLRMNDKFRVKSATKRVFRKRHGVSEFVDGSSARNTFREKCRSVP